MKTISKIIYSYVRRRPSLFIKCIHILFISLLSTVVTAAPGDLDASFGINGKVIAANGHGVRNVETQLDKKILVQTHETISRYLPNGDIDLSFGVGGVTYAGGGRSSNFVLKKNGKIIVLTYGAVMQLRSDGSGDGTFGGGDGEFRLDFLPLLHFSLITLQDDERPILLGYNNSDDARGIYVIRLKSDGSLDPSFATGGVIRIPFPNQAAYGTAIKIDRSTGNILVGAQVIRYVVGADSFFEGSYLARLRANGVMDPTFGENGIKTFSRDDEVFMKTIHITPNNKIYVAGPIWIEDEFTTPIVRFNRLNANGMLDPSFSRNNFPYLNRVTDIEMHPNGKFLYLGSIYDRDEEGNEYEERAVVRINEFSLVDLSLKNGSGQLSLQPDGKFVLASDGEDYRYQEIARYLNDDFDLKPNALRSTSRDRVAPRSTVTSHPIKISGISDATFVPLNIKNGTYNINNGPFTKNPGWVKQGDIVRVRHLASNRRNGVTKSILTVGGLQSPNNIGLVLGDRVSTTLTSKTDSGHPSNKIATPGIFY